jgi:hypothetical protein
VASLRRELDGQDRSDIEVGELRRRLAWVLGALRHQRANESDLIYEAYYDAFQHDLEEDLETP